MKVRMRSIGIALLCIYIFTSYNALDVVIPSTVTSLSLFLLVAFGVLAWLTSIKQSKVALPVYSLWYFAFMLFSLLTMVYSPEKSILSGEFYLMIVSFVLTLVFSFFVRSDRVFTVMGWTYVLSSGALVLTLILTGNMIADASDRLGGSLMGNANTFASLIMVAVMYAMWLLMYDRTGKMKKVILLAIIMLDYYALILSAGRKFFIIPFVFLYILLMFRVDKKGKKHMLRYTVYTVVLVTLAWYLVMNVPQFYETIGYRLESYVNGILGVAEQGASAAIRERMQQLAMEKWIESPLLGYGFDSFKYYNVGVTGYFYYSHCNFTEMLYNGGIVCFLLYYWIYWRILKNVFLIKKGQLKYRAFAGGVAICLLIFDYGAVSYSIAIIHIMLALALVMLDEATMQKNDGEIRNE